MASEIGGMSLSKGIFGPETTISKINDIAIGVNLRTFDGSMEGKNSGKERRKVSAAF